MPLGSLGRDDPGSAGAAVPGFSCGHFLGLPLLEAPMSIIEGSHPAVAAGGAGLSQTPGGNEGLRLACALAMHTEGIVARA